MPNGEGKLWILKRTEEEGIDETIAVVVRAPSENSARALASTVAGDEGAEAWFDPDRSTCQRVFVDGTSEVILRSYRAG